MSAGRNGDEDQHGVVIRRPPLPDRGHGRRLLPRDGRRPAPALAALILGAFLGPRSTAQKAEPPAAGQAGPGRYQAVPGNAKDCFFVVLDTQTGHCWSSSAGNSADMSWIDLGSPAEKK